MNPSFPPCTQRIRYLFAAWAVVLVAFLSDTALGAAFIYVANDGSQTVGLYTTSGGAINPNLITGLNEVNGLAVADGFLYVSTFGTGIFGGKVGKYTLTGEPVNPSLITGLTQPSAIAISGTDLYVNNVGTSRVGKYTTSGGIINPSFITVTGGGAEAVAVAGSSVYVAISGNNRIAEFSASTGAPINDSLIPNVYGSNLAVSGSDLYVVQSSAIGKYSISGSVENASLITGLQSPFGIAVDGSELYVSDFFPTSRVGAYTTSGATVNASLITAGLNRPYGIAVTSSNLPEPSTFTLFVLGANGVLFASRRRTVRRSRSFCFELSQSITDQFKEQP
jgi:hypothetical protein